MKRDQFEEGSCQLTVKKVSGRPQKFDLFKESRSAAAVFDSDFVGEFLEEEFGASGAELCFFSVDPQFRGIGGEAEEKFLLRKIEIFPDQNRCSRRKSESCFSRIGFRGGVNAGETRAGAGEIGPRIGFGSAPVPEEERFVGSELHAHVFQLFRRGIFTENRSRGIPRRHAEEKKGQNQNAEHDQNGICAAPQSITNHQFFHSIFSVI